MKHQTRKSDPLGRNHATVQRKANRTAVDSVCDYILEHEAKDFKGQDGGVRPSVHHVYYDAYLVIYGMKAAAEMLRAAQREWEEETK